MKRKFLLLNLLIGLLLSSCSKDEEQTQVKPPIKQKVENEAPKPQVNTDKVDLNDYKDQELFNLGEVNLSNVKFKSDVTYQKVEGFGAMLMPQGWDNSVITTKEHFQSSFKDLGLNIIRLYIPANSNGWSYAVPYCKAVTKSGAIAIACCWDAPEEYCEKIKEIVWTDGNKESKSKEVKHLLESHYSDYANHLINYVNYMKKQGVSIYALSVQNEPDAEFTFWYPEEIAKFTAQYGAKIVEETGVKLITPEACGTRQDYTDAILNNAKAYAATDIIGGHLYQGFSNFYGTSHNGYVKARYDYINKLWDRIKADNKQWWMTEHLFNEGEKSASIDDWKFLTWDYCFNHLGLEMHDCMKASCSAYIYWYLKRFYGLIYDADKRCGNNAEDTYAHNAFIMSQWANFATGKTRIEATSDDPDVKVTAYKSDEGNLSFVALNFGDKVKYLSVEVDYDEIAAFGQIADRTCQDDQKIKKVRPNCFTKRVVLTIPPKAIGSMTILKP